MFQNLNVIDILQIGVIGLGFLLAVLAFHLLTKEQKEKSPRQKIINSIYVFMLFSVVLCVIGIISQTDIFNIKSDTEQISGHDNTPTTENTNHTLYSYFADVRDNNEAYICTVGKFVYSEKNLGNNKTFLEGKITGSMKDDDGNLVDGSWDASGYIDNYFMKISYDTGVAYLEYNKRDYIGYWLGEADDPDIKALICPWVLSPTKEGLSEENAKKTWPILNEPCRILQSLKDISK